MGGEAVNKGKHARLRSCAGTARRRPKAFAGLAVGAVAVMVLGANFVISAQGAGAATAAQAAPSGLSVTDLATGATAAGLASSLTGSGVTISNVTFTGSTRAAGSFTSGDNSIVGFG